MIIIINSTIEISSINGKNHDYKILSLLKICKIRFWIKK